MNNSANHSQLVNQVLLKFHKKYPHGRLWKSHSGLGYTPESVIKVINHLLSYLFSFENWKRQSREDVFKEVRNMLVPIKYGMNGQADLTGIVNGKRIEIEIKTGTGKQRDTQKAFEKMITDCGGFYIVIRTIEDLDDLQF